MLGASASSVIGSPRSLPAAVLVALGGIWIFAWPAWRMYPVRGRRWWTQIARGAGRAVLVVLALGLIAVLLTLLAATVLPFWPVAGFTLSISHSIVALIALGFGPSRLAVLAGAWVVWRMRTRLRWRLLASHVAVIILTFASLTAVGSVVALAIILHSAQPNSVEMGRSLREQLQLTGRPTDARRARHLFLAVAAGRVELRGKPPLSFLSGSIAVPEGIALLTPDGHVLAAVRTGRGVLTVQRAAELPGVTPAAWDRLRTAALRGQARSLSLHFPGTGSGQQSDLSEVPIQNARGRTEAILLVAAGGPTATTTQFFRVVLVLFGATTVALISIAALPLLAVSFGGSYLVARGLTQRLEAVSRVATAIAGGNFAERAPVSSQDEVGQLAGDVNRMAGRLEQMVAELTQARSQAEEALHTRQELVANVSHELRTPLAVLRAHLESIAARESVPAGSGTAAELTVPAGTIDALQGETARLAAIIDDLFALARVEAGRLPLEHQAVDVGAVIDEVVRFMRPLAQRESAVTLSLDVPPGLPLVSADPGRLHQILSNLVRNAIRHTPEGGIVALSARSTGDRVSIAVADTGEGIAPDDLPHVFDRFYRADPSRSRSTGGAGLGLSIVRELVELMGGTVTAESALDGGSTFTVSLPVILPDGVPPNCAI
jgi:signal transduction histidine kinase